MKKPTILSIFHDTERNMTYRVFAFRPLSGPEMIQAIKLYSLQPKIQKLKTPERNKTVTTDSLMGSEINLALVY